MFRFEDHLKPRLTGAAWPRDAVCIATLGVLWIILMPAWGADLGLVRTLGWGPSDRFISDVVGQLTCPLLLVCLAFLLGLRFGAINLSVWTAAATGSLVAAALIRRLGADASVSPGWVACCLAAGAVCGGILGAVNGLLTAWCRLPSAVVTLATALLTIALLQGAFPERDIQLRDNTFARWHLTEKYYAYAENASTAPADANAPRRVVLVEDARPLLATRMFLVGCLFAFALAVLLILGDHPHWHRQRLISGIVVGGVILTALISNHFDEKVGIAFLAAVAVVLGAAWLGTRTESPWTPRATMMAAMTAGGFLAGAGGSLWLLDLGAAPVPTFGGVLGDLRVPAVAILAGGWLLAGKNRTMLAAALLPPALLLTTIWQVKVWIMREWGLCLQDLALAGLLLTMHLSLAAAGNARGRKLAIVATVLAGAGLVAVALAARQTPFSTRNNYRLAGASACLVALGMLLIWAVRFRRAKRELS